MGGSCRDYPSTETSEKMATCKDDRCPWWPWACLCWHDALDFPADPPDPFSRCQNASIASQYELGRITSPSSSPSPTGDEAP